MHCEKVEKRDVKRWELKKKAQKPKGETKWGAFGQGPLREVEVRRGLKRRWAPQEKKKKKERAERKGVQRACAGMSKVSRDKSKKQQRQRKHTEERKTRTRGGKKSRGKLAKNLKENSWPRRRPGTTEKGGTLTGVGEREIGRVEGNDMREGR